MRILQLCKKFPYPLKDGESIAVSSLSKALHVAGAEITLLAMNTSKHFFDLTETPVDLSHYHAIHTVGVDNRIKPLDAFLNLFTASSYHVSRFISADFKKKLILVLQQQNFDIIQLESLYLSPYIPVIRAYSKAKIVMRAHNVEHEIWERVVQHTRFIPKRMYLQLLVDRLKRYEINQLKQYDLLAAISARDLSRFMAMGYANPAIVTPIGISMNAYKPDFKSYHRELSVGFIGSLDWIPNVEGVQWFLMDVWGEISNQFSKLTLQIAGRNPPRWISDMKVNNIQVLGEVPDAAQFMNQHAILVVPLLSGSGMRAKILEAMALGKIVITTSIGLEGIPARDKKEVLIANTTEEFLEALHFCHQQNGQLEQMGKKAIEFVRDHFEYQEIGRQLMAKYSALQPATEQV